MSYDVGKVRIEVQPSGGMFVKKAVGGIKNIPLWDAQSQTSAGDRPNQWGGCSLIKTLGEEIIISTPWDKGRHFL